MDLSEQVREFRVLQKTHRIRVADFCRERTLDYYEMVEALKKDKFLSELPKEEIEMGEVEITDYPLEWADPRTNYTLYIWLRFAIEKHPEEIKKVVEHNLLQKGGIQETDIDD